MMKQQRSLYLFISMALLMVGAVHVRVSDAGWFGWQMTRDIVRIQKQDGTEFLFHVEVAQTNRQHKEGLMNRKRLAENAGMLFLFGDEDMRVFWMKDTLIPLDMLFIAKDGTIEHIHHNAKPLDEAHITSERPAMAVLEINGGIADKYGITEGDKVLHAEFRNTLAP